MTRTLASSERDQVEVLGPENPFPGLSFFTEADSEYFKGRTQEIGWLTQLIRRQTLTVLFGASGLGKTSLLQAGLFPQLRSAGFFPVRIVLSNFSQTDSSLAQQVLERVQAAAVARQVECPEARLDETLWEYFHRAHFWDRSTRLLTPVLVLDQFETMFTLGAGDPRVTVFLTELANLIENRIPAGVEDRYLDPDNEFSFAIDKQPYKVVLSFREDFLAEFEDLRYRIPSLERNKFRLTPLSGRNAEIAVSEPGSEILDSDLAEKIVLSAAGLDHSGDSRTRLDDVLVEPAILALVCRKLNDKRIERDEPRITSDMLVGGREEIYGTFYRECLEKLPENARKPVRVFIEDSLLTESGFRTAAPLEEAIADEDAEPEHYQTLVSSRLLRQGDRLGIPHIELIHDVLCPVVRESRDKREDRESGSRKRKKIARRVAFAVVSYGVIVGAFAINASRERAEASQERAEAQATARGDSIAAAEARRAAARAEANLALTQLAIVQGQQDSLINEMLAEAERAMSFMLFTGDQLHGIGQPFLLDDLARDLRQFARDQSSGASTRIRDKAIHYEGLAALERARTSGDQDEAIRALVMFERYRSVAGEELARAEADSGSYSQGAAVRHWLRELGAANLAAAEALDVTVQMDDPMGDRWTSARTQFHELAERDTLKSSLADYASLFASSQSTMPISELTEVRNKKFEEADARFGRLLGSDPLSDGARAGVVWGAGSDAATHDLVELLVRRGSVANREGRLEEALDDLGRALNLLAEHAEKTERRTLEQRLLVNRLVAEILEADGLAAPEGYSWEYALVANLFEDLESRILDSTLVKRIWARGLRGQRIEDQQAAAEAWTSINYRLTSDIAVDSLDRQGRGPFELVFLTQFDHHSTDRAETESGRRIYRLRVQDVQGWRITNLSYRSHGFELAVAGR